MKLSTAPVTQDLLLNGALRLWQPEKGYRFAIDPVFLSASVPVKAGDYVVELGAGVGTASFCLLKRQPDVHLVAVEFQEELALLAAKNAKENGLEKGFSLFQADIANKEQMQALNAQNKADHVFSNPPYLPEGHGRDTENQSKYRANVETTANLKKWITVSSYLLKPKGWLTMIHRADRLDEILHDLSAAKFGSMKIFPLWPKQGEHARRVIIQARAHSKGPAQICAGLVLHDQDGQWTIEAAKILDGNALVF